MNQSIVHGYTEITVNNNMYRCHPFYANTGSWYDRAYFGWDGFDSCIPARLLMILDLSEFEINYEVVIDKDKVSEVDNVPTLTHLTKDKWVVIKAATLPSVLSYELTDTYCLPIV